MTGEKEAGHNMDQQQPAQSNGNEESQARQDQKDPNNNSSSNNNDNKTSNEQGSQDADDPEFADHPEIKKLKKFIAEQREAEERRAAAPRRQMPASNTRVVEVLRQTVWVDDGGKVPDMQLLPGEKWTGVKYWVEEGPQAQRTYCWFTRVSYPMEIPWRVKYDIELDIDDEGRVRR
ncbi:hypothetical protein KCU92_g3307, partial [Aureobasidium melanogenum]|jgi:hypothetical protein